jgi:hypothetical protein
MGLHITVLRGSRNGRVIDYTMDGISSKADSLYLVNVDGPCEPDDTAPAALLIAGALPGTLKIVPATKGLDGSYVRVPGWFMMGGNYGATSDSRFSEACENILGYRFYGAVAIHDRNEG